MADALTTMLTAIYRIEFVRTLTRMKLYASLDSTCFIKAEKEGKDIVCCMLRIKCKISEGQSQDFKQALEDCERLRVAITINDKPITIEGRIIESQPFLPEKIPHFVAMALDDLPYVISPDNTSAPDELHWYTANVLSGVYEMQNDLSTFLPQFLEQPEHKVFDGKHYEYAELPHLTQHLTQEELSLWSEMADDIVGDTSLWRPEKSQTIMLNEFPFRKGGPGLLVGTTGTGKTLIASIIAPMLARLGFAVAYLTPTGVAANTAHNFVNKVWTKMSKHTASIQGRPARAHFGNEVVHATQADKFDVIDPAESPVMITTINNATTNAYITEPFASTKKRAAMIFDDSNEISSFDQLVVAIALIKPVR